MNRSPTLSVKDMPPEECWSGLKPSVHHFRVFGCVAYVHIPDVQRKKLDGKSIQCINLCVSEESKAYRLFDPVEKKIVVSRDVVFDKAKGWNCLMKDQKSCENDDNCISDEDNKGQATAEEET
jgi:regulator of RNase E activity RraB